MSYCASVHHILAHYESLTLKLTLQWRAATANRASILTRSSFQVCGLRPFEWLSHNDVTLAHAWESGPQHTVMPSLQSACGGDLTGCKNSEYYLNGAR